MTNAPISKEQPVENAPIDDIDVGRRLRELRATRDISLRVLAEQSGLNVNTLSLIENRRTSPSVSTLQQLAQTLQVPISAFFETDHGDQLVVHQKVGNRPRAAFTHGSIEDLGAGMPALGRNRSSSRSLQMPIVARPQSYTPGVNSFTAWKDRLLIAWIPRIMYSIRVTASSLKPICLTSGKIWVPPLPVICFFSVHWMNATVQKSVISQGRVYAP